ncbi:MAG: DUF4280 domain-containing protein [Pseudomonadota bacterium]|nr:DUF4280 domain-containing protein [Pseudomonadota bacterium]
MPFQVCCGATLKCSFGTQPSTLAVVAPEQQVAPGKAPATILNHQPVVNIQSFGLCQSLANPAVASATSAASGVLTPQPCVPVTPAPWTPGSPTTLIGHAPALNHTSQLMCTWAGVIEVAEPGQARFQIP